MKDSTNLKDVVIVALGTIRARNMSIAKVASAMAKSFELTDEEQLLLEGCLIEEHLGFSHMDNSPAKPLLSPNQLLDLYEQAVASPDKEISVEGQSCTTKAVVATIRHFLKEALLK